MAKRSGTGNRRRKASAPGTESLDESTDGQAPDAATGEEVVADDAAEVRAEPDETPSPDEAGEPSEVTTAEPEATAADDLPQAEATPVPEAPARRSGGFLPMLLGGVLAAAIGAGGLWLAVTRGWVAPGGGEEIAALSGKIAAQADRIAGLEARLETEEAAASTLTNSVAALEDALAAAQAAQQEALATAAPRAALDALGQDVAALRDRLGQLEVQPIPEAELPEEVAAAYDAKLAEMQAALDTRLAEIEARIEARLAAVEAEAASRMDALSRAAETAAEVEARARAAQDRAAAQAAFARLGAALETGAPFGAELAEIAERTGVSAPPVLVALADTGAPSLDDLRAGFPDAARAALVAATRVAAESGEVDRWTAFLRTQLGARSLEPREGSDPDAILSRAEAALAAGDLDTALAEIATLPEAGRAELADWVRQAQTRLEALVAVDALGAELGTN